MPDETTPPNEPADSGVPSTPADSLADAAPPIVAEPPALIEPSATGDGRTAQPVDDDAVDDEVVGYDAVPAKGHAAGTETGVAEPGPAASGPVDDDTTVLPAAAAPVAAAPSAPVPVAPVPAAAEPGTVPPAVSPLGVAAPAVVYVAPPVPPRAKHNRGFAIGIMLLSSLVFTIVFAAINAGFIALRSTSADYETRLLDFAHAQAFYVPVIAYVVFACLLGLLLNRAGPFAHALSSLVVGLLVYASSVAVELLVLHFWQYDTSQRLMLLSQLAMAPQLIIAGAVGRETALWFGFIQARRGRRLRERNRQAKADFEAEQAGAVPDVG